LRAENNRYYIRNGIELRPGFAAKWIEVSLIESRDPGTVIRNIIYRHENQSLENEKKKAELQKINGGPLGVPPGEEFL